MSELARTLNPWQEGFSSRLVRTGELRLSEANRAGAKKTKRIAKRQTSKKLCYKAFQRHKKLETVQNSYHRPNNTNWQSTGDRTNSNLLRLQWTIWKLAFKMVQPVVCEAPQLVFIDLEAVALTVTHVTWGRNMLANVSADINELCRNRDNIFLDNNKKQCDVIFPHPEAEHAKLIVSVLSYFISRWKTDTWIK